MPDRVWTPGGRRLMFDCCAAADSKEAVGEVGLLSPCTDLGQLLPLNSWLLEGEVRSSQTSIGDRHGSQRGEVDREDQGQESWLEGRLCWWKSSAQVCICIIFFFFLCETLIWLIWVCIHYILFTHGFLSERERSPLKERNSNKYRSPSKGSPSKRDIPITLSPANQKQV